MISAVHRVVVITPVYEDFSAFNTLLHDLYGVLGHEAFVIAVDDGSVHAPVDASCFSDSQISGTVLRLKRNVGHQKAIATGLSYVAQQLRSGQVVVVMDSDGEDRPKDIPSLLSKLQDPNVDVVVAARAQRTESLSFRAFYVIYKQMFGLLTGKPISFGNFMVMTPFAAKRLVSMPELSIHIAATVIASKLRVGTCSIDRGTRYAGKSKMNFAGLVLHGFRGMMVFAEEVVVRVGLLCGGIAILCLLGAVLAVLLKLIGQSTPGWFSIALGLLVIIFMQTGALALMILMLSGMARRAEDSKNSSQEDLISSVSVAD